ncbi:hypothetical protein [Nocardia macrotermitis]|uniref:Uncharacterized protein n=1 Tax=Nocardia macrotermitis TaxID=2585198 RepID=A0A7K0DAQ4_9NOCA|nr:hypothetical protein [Nocardia macrotermitis]MQY22860.1 hypothetical protein [Nocardia macrotermitis]
MDLALEWDRHPGTGLRLANELAGAAGLAVAEDLGPAPGRLGILAARRDGELVGWAALTGDADARARTEPVYTSRYARRIRLGHNDFEPATDAEETVVEALTAGLAGQARALGYRVLRWRGTDIGPEGRAATVLGAVAVGEYARVWTAEPRTWRAPMALTFGEPVDCVLHALTESTEPPGQSLVVALLTPDSADPVASVATSVVGSAAYIDAGSGISYRDVDPGGLAALVGAVITELHDQVPQALVLRVFEHDDQRIRTALATAGLALSARCRDYELALGSAN